MVRTQFHVIIILNTNSGQKRIVQLMQKTILQYITSLPTLLLHENFFQFLESRGAAKKRLLGRTRLYSFSKRMLRFPDLDEDNACSTSKT